MLGRAALTRVDPAVCELKFEREVQRLADQRLVLESHGIFVLGNPTFPNVDLLYVHRHELSLVLPVQQSGLIQLPTGFTTAAPMAGLAPRAFRARFNLTDYDLRAPSLEFRDAWTGVPLKYNECPRAFEYEKHRLAHLVLLDDHPSTHKPFLCLRGIREYHEHPQHSGDDWLLYRRQMNLFSAAMALWRACIDLAHATIVPIPNGLQVQWIAEEKD